MGLLFEIYQHIYDQMAIVNYKCPYNLQRDWDFNLLEKYIKKLDLLYLTSSVELDELYECGDYLFHFGEDEGIYFIYSESTHSFMFPSRISIFDPIHEFSIENDLDYDTNEIITVYECNSDLYNIFCKKDNDERKDLLIQWLKNTNRPRLIPF